MLDSATSLSRPFPAELGNPGGVVLGDSGINGGVGGAVNHDYLLLSLRCLMCGKGTLALSGLLVVLIGMARMRKRVRMTV